MGGVRGSGPEEHEEGVPVDDGIFDDVGDADGLVKGVGHELVDVRGAGCMECYSDDGEGDSDGEEEVEGTAKERASEGLDGGCLQEGEADSTGG